ncbi:MAG: tRNA(Met) cytidine acetyltransferase [Desulfurococcales archaeon]|nr:tRNA(Met) cytidine acetyltransferase [Desulfurococcales archaeon]
MVGKTSINELRKKLREVVGDDYRRFTKKLIADARNALISKERRLVVISGDDPYKVGGIAADVVRKYVSKLLRSGFIKQRASIVHVFHDEFPDGRIRARILKNVLSRDRSVDFQQSVYEVSQKFLGTTVDVLILDLCNDLKPNDVGRLLGIVKGGGIVVLLTPPLRVWNDRDTIFRTNLAVPNHPHPRKVFIKYFVRKLHEHDGIYIFDTDTGKFLKSGYRRKKDVKRKPLKIPERRVFPKEIYEMALTQDQINVIKLFEDHLVPNPGRKHIAIVIVADRGRGKSCAVGISLVGFIQELLKVKNRVRIAVTAAEPLSIQSLMRLAEKTLDALGMKYREVVKGGNVIEVKGERFSIEYWEPYTVLRLGVDVVVVDEAAGIPVPLLHRIWRKFRRTVYSTTVHGYEGAGRGFQVKFLKKLKESKKTKLLIYEMEEPIRYSQGDPVEDFLFDVLKLSAEPQELTDEDIEDIKRGDFEYVKYDPEYLFSLEGEKELSSLFGIYVLAHYRNEPDDLGRIADAPHHSIRAVKLRRSGKIVGAAQLAEEGGLPDDVIDELLQGGRIPGNIIPDRLLKHLRVRDFGRGIGWRIVRIAVHIDAQGLGIGSYLLKEIVNEAARRGYDWVGAGFGVSKELMSFWVKNGFYPVHLSPERNRVSGEYTSIVVKPLTGDWERLISKAIEEFSVKLVESLHSVYWDFEPDVIYLLFREALKNSEYASLLRLSEIQEERLKAYVEGIMTYESVADAVNIVLKKAVLSGGLREVDEKEAVIGIARALQGRLWDAIYEELRISKGKAVSALRKLVGRILGYSD